VTDQPASSEEWTVRRVLDWTIEYLGRHNSESPRLDAEILLAHARGCPRIKLYTDYDERLPDEVRTRMRAYVKRRAAAEPVAYLVGHREFFSLKFEVSPAVLIPRPDTETLVVEALDRLKPLTSPRVLDIGTGSGCIAVSVAVNHRDALVTAVDISPEALEVARRNAQLHSVAARVKFVRSDLTAALNEHVFDMIVANPPYVTTGECDYGLDPTVRRHEPRAALDGGADGLDIIRRLVEVCPERLVSGGSLLLECSPEQVEAVRDLMSARFKDVATHNDLGGLPRIVCGRRR